MKMWNDLLNAFNHSRATIEIQNDTAKIATMVRSGRHVVVEEHVVFCPSTDAAIGTAIYLVDDYATQDEALAAFQELYATLDGDMISAHVEPRVPFTPAPVDPDFWLKDLDCPF